MPRPQITAVSASAAFSLPVGRCVLSGDKPSPLFRLSPQEEIHSNVEVVHTYRQHILNDMNPSNLHLFISAYNR